MNAALRRAVKTNSQLKAMGTTFASIAFEENSGKVSIRHLGDSRIYRIRSGTLEQLTKDHSLRELAPSKKQKSIPANLVTRCLGSEYDEGDGRTLEVISNDAYLLCTDGVWGSLEKSQFGEVVLKTFFRKDGATRLIQTCLDAGGRDNLTAIFVNVRKS
jgi:protein phosphatase